MFEALDKNWKDLKPSKRDCYTPDNKDEQYSLCKGGKTECENCCLYKDMNMEG